jgi:uncharacterized protein (DUF2126 family)
VSLPGCTLEVRRALEFWPLLGDAASPEQGGTSRLVDASTTRIELRLRPAADALGRDDWLDWQVSAAGVSLPWRSERDERGELKVCGIRYRSFVPAWGLHPALGAQAPVALRLRHPGRTTARVVTLHEWQPNDEAYPGLPEDLVEAARRRAERITISEESVAEPAREAADTAPVPGPAREIGAYCLDLRYFDRGR